MSEENKDIGPRLISAMYSMGLDTKAKIKAATGLTDHAIWRYGEGNRAPSLSQLKRIALALPELDLYWIITGQHRPKAGALNMPTLERNGEYIIEDWYKNWLHEHRLEIDQLAGWEITESSWEPILLPGDHVIFDRTSKDLHQAGPYIITLDNGSPIMRKVEPAGQDKYLLSSSTPHTIEISGDEINVLGRVVAVLHQKCC